MQLVQAKGVSENGQTLILLVFAMSIVFAIGVIIVDFGLWFSERRGAQATADFSVLAGAQTFLDNPDDSAGAFNDAVQFAVSNGTDPNAIDGTSTSSCSAEKSCIAVGRGDCYEDGSTSDMPWVEAKIRRPAGSLFTGILDIATVDIGAVARACVGSPREAYDLSPFGVQTGYNAANGDPETGGQCSNDLDDDGDGVVNDGCPLSGCMEPNPEDSTRTRPVYGAVCILKTGAQQSVSGQRGQLTIGPTCREVSASTLKHDFHYGTGAPCALGQEINTGSGNIIGLLQGLNLRLLDEGRCDELFYTGHADYDDFDEVFAMPGSGGPVVPSPDNIFSSNPCEVNSDPNASDSDGNHVHTYLPRAIDLVLIDQLEQGAQTATITGFAAFYVIGCFNDSIAEATKAAIETDLTNFDALLNRCDRPGAQDDILGIFVKSLRPPALVGDPDPNLPLAIVLVK